MTEANRVTQNYQGMTGGAGGQQAATNAKSGTQEELAQLRSGERWSLTATERTYNAGGNENGTMQEGSPQQQ